MIKMRDKITRSSLCRLVLLLLIISSAAEKDWCLVNAIIGSRSCKYIFDMGLYPVAEQENCGGKSCVYPLQLCAESQRHWSPHFPLNAARTCIEFSQECAEAVDGFLKKSPVCPSADLHRPPPIFNATTPAPFLRTVDLTVLRKILAEHLPKSFIIQEIDANGNTIIEEPGPFASNVKQEPSGYESWPPVTNPPTWASSSAPMQPGWNQPSSPPGSQPTSPGGQPPGGQPGLGSPPSSAPLPPGWGEPAPDPLPPAVQPPPGPPGYGAPFTQAPIIDSPSTTPAPYKLTHEVITSLLKQGIILAPQQSLGSLFNNHQIVQLSPISGENVPPHRHRIDSFPGSDTEIRGANAPYGGGGSNVNSAQPNANYDGVRSNAPPPAGYNNQGSQSPSTQPQPPSFQSSGYVAGQNPAQAPSAAHSPASNVNSAQPNANYGGVGSNVPLPTGYNNQGFQSPATQPHPPSFQGSQYESGQNPAQAPFPAYSSASNVNSAQPNAPSGQPGNSWSYSGPSSAQLPIQASLYPNSGSNYAPGAAPPASVPNPPGRQPTTNQGYAQPGSLQNPAGPPPYAQNPYPTGPPSAGYNNQGFPSPATQPQSPSFQGSQYGSGQNQAQGPAYSPAGPPYTTGGLAAPPSAVPNAHAASYGVPAANFPSPAFPTNFPAPAFPPNFVPISSPGSVSPPASGPRPPGTNLKMEPNDLLSNLNAIERRILELIERNRNEKQEIIQPRVPEHRRRQPLVIRLTKPKPDEPSRPLEGLHNFCIVDAIFSEKACTAYIFDLGLFPVNELNNCGGQQCVFPGQFCADSRDNGQKCVNLDAECSAAIDRYIFTNEVRCFDRKPARKEKEQTVLNFGRIPLPSINDDCVVRGMVGDRECAASIFEQGVFPSGNASNCGGRECRFPPQFCAESFLGRFLGHKCIEMDLVCMKSVAGYISSQEAEECASAIASNRAATRTENLVQLSTPRIERCYDPVTEKSGEECQGHCQRARLSLLKRHESLCFCSSNQRGPSCSANVPESAPYPDQRWSEVYTDSRMDFVSETKNVLRAVYSVKFFSDCKSLCESMNQPGEDQILCSSVVFHQEAGRGICELFNKKPVPECQAWLLDSIGFTTAYLESISGDLISCQ